MSVLQIHRLKLYGFRLRVVAALLAAATCALFAPWWGSPIVAATSYLVLRLPTRILCMVTFAAWIIACALRDFMNDYGPSRVFAKMLSVEAIGLPIDSLVARLSVYTLVGFLGFLLALFTGGILKSILAILPAPKEFKF